MRLRGSRTIAATREAIWTFLTSPARLRHCLPGCERFESTGPDSYTATMSLGVGLIKGTYTGTIRITDQRRPEQMTLLVEGGGGLGSLVAAGKVTLTELAGGTDQTYLTYDGDATVTGPVAMVGERVMGATADRLFAAFLNCVTSQIEK